MGYPSLVIDTVEIMGDQTSEGFHGELEDGLSHL